MPAPTRAKIIQAGDCHEASNQPPKATTSRRSVPAITGPIALPAPNDEKYRHKPKPKNP